MKKVLEVNVDDLYSGGVFSLIKNVIANKQCDMEIDIASIEQFEKPSNVDELHSYGAHVHYIGHVGSKWKKQFVCYSNLKKLLKTQKYECVHIHSDVANKLLVSGLSAKHAGVNKIILHSHAAGVDGNHRSIKLLFHKLCRRVLKYIGTDYVACSDLAAKWMFPNILQEQIKIINNGVELEKFRFDPSKRGEIRRSLGVHDEILLGHVGRFAYQKNHGYLISIMHEIKKRGIKAKLLLVGEGPDETKIRNRVKEEHLEDIIMFYGTSNRVNELFQAMDIFVLPSHFEGLPIVGVEAQAAGLPVIFSDQITREAKLIAPVEYLAIAEEAVSDWVTQIERFSKYKRQDTYLDLKKRKFSLQDTIDSFLDLYS